MGNSFKSKVKYFLKETLRPRTLEDYGEFFSRGMKNGDGKNPQVPWLYLRALALGFILFAIAMLGYRLSRGSVDYMTAIVAGGLCVNIPVLIFFFELYPQRDLSLFLLLFIVLVGGITSGAIITLGYEYIYGDPFNEIPWVSTLWTGFLEELCKGAVAIAAIALLKKKNPFVCFLIGFAVGTGYSIFEDLGYIYSYSGGQRFHWVVLMSLGRGLSCAFSHAPWTGLIGWAFVRFRKPFLNYRFYLVALSSMVLHYLADVTFFVEELDVLSGITWGWAIDAVVVIAIVLLQFFVLRGERRALVSPICTGEYAEQLEITETAQILTRAQKLSHAGNLTAVLCAVFISALSLVGCSLNTVITAIYKNFYDEQSFIDYVQNGLPLYADFTRVYNAGEENYSQFVAEGELKCAVQKQADGDYDYFYIYGFSEEGAMLESVAVKVDGIAYYCSLMLLYEHEYTVFTLYPENFVPVFDDPKEDGGESDEPEELPDQAEPPEYPEEPLKTLTFFDIKGKSIRYDFDGQYFQVLNGYTQNDNTPIYIALGAVAGIALAGGAAAFVTLKIKARRMKND